MKTHIVQVITELEPAGAERILANLSIELKKRGFGVTVISVQGPPSVKTISNELKDNGIEVFYLNTTKKTLWRVFGLNKFIKKIREKYIDSRLIVHSHLMHANLACRFAKLLGEKFLLINTIHIAERRQNQKMIFLLDKLTFKLCDIYTAVSQAAAKWHAEKLKQSAGLISVVHNGIKLPASITDDNKKQLISEWNFNACNKIIGSIGRLDWQKGYDVFFSFLSELSKSIPGGETWGIVILGEGRQRPELETPANTAPKNIKVLLPGYRKDAAECIGAFDLFVMPSRYEGFGLVLLEAMAHGIPILTSNADSLPELLKNYPNGKYIDFNNSTETIENILEYINRPAIIFDNMDDFTVEKMADSYIKLYGV